MRRASLIALLPVAVSSLMFAAGCGNKPAEAGPAKPSNAAPAGTMVTTSEAASGDISNSIEVNGSLVALQDVTVGANQAGRIAQVLLHEGDTVTAGQTVAVMDVADLQAQVQSARAGLQSAISRAEQARVALLQAQSQKMNSETTLKWTGKTTATALDTARTTLSSAQERLAVVKQGARRQERQQAEEQVKSAKANLDKAKSDLKRYQELYRQQAISQSQLVQAETTFDGAQAAYNAAQQALSLIKEGSRPEDIRQAELAVQQAKEQIVRAEADRDQITLREQDVKLAQAAIDSARAGLTSANSAVQQSSAMLKIAEEGLSKAKIVSPISGIVSERKAEPGQQIGGGGPVMRIVNPDSVYFQATLAENQYQQVKLQQSAVITVDALPGKTIKGTVTRILPVASASARSFTLRIDFPTSKALRPEMFARGSILLDVHKGVTLVSKDAVIYDTVNNKTRLFVVSGGKAEEKEITVGYSNPKSVEVLGGTIKPGDKVIVAGQNTLQNGDTIRVGNS